MACSLSVLQVIARDAPAPPLPAVRNRTPYYHQLSAQVDPYNLALLCFNKTPNNKERLCAICKTHYRYAVPLQVCSMVAWAGRPCQWHKHYTNHWVGYSLHFIEALLP